VPDLGQNKRLSGFSHLEKIGDDQGVFNLIYASMRFRSGS
jgi:hypothetical protein